MALWNRPRARARLKEHVDRHAAGALTEYRHVAGIAAKPFNIRSDPPERGDLVKKTESAGPCFTFESGVCEEAKPAQSVVRVHETDPTLREARPLLKSGRTDPIHESVSVNPDHHRCLCGGPCGRSPHVEEQAIFAWLCPDGRGVGRERRLRAIRP